MNWRLLKRESVDFSHSDTVARFRKLISIWRTRCNTVNKRLSGTVLIDKDSPEYFKILSSVNLFGRYNLEIFKFIPKSKIFSMRAYEVSLFTDDHLSVEFFPCTLDNKRHPQILFPYKLKFRNLEICDERQCCELLLFVEDENHDSTWLCDCAFPALIRWLKGMDNHRSNIANLNLIDLDNYAQTYRMIKENFGHQIAANWKEKTDPRKFVYEDCAIAAYLLETWRRKKRFPQNFCDVGCGNGLLVYLLYKLQVKGYGVDIRKRNIWLDFKGADLRELALNPELETNSDCNEFRRVDYLIGNHCDELTPWIPVIAARLRCDFFLLPCCPYDFYSRYRKKSKSSAGYSSYWSYLDYIKSICMRLGYKVEEDGLKIPSTKRYCFVCSVPNEKLPEDIDARISEILLTSKSGNFIPREKISQIRNCIRCELHENTIRKIVSHLLESAECAREWRRGNTCNILEIANLLDSNEKNQLKNSNGGVKTFLKNQHQIFYVAGNEVSIRNWPVEGQRHVEGKLKTRKCWFKENHPDGCPLSDTDCSYSHIF